MHDLSDEVLCARWGENPYYQFFCGELSFCHQLPFDRSSLTHWRQRLGEEQLVALLQESLSVVVRSLGNVEPHVGAHQRQYVEPLLERHCSRRLPLCLIRDCRV